jgi:hypothetical protein
VPLNLAATAGNGSAALTWTAPAANGGSAITGYRVTTTGAAAPAPVTVTGTSATITGLTNGSSYTFTVAAVNGAGTGPVAGPTAGVTPRAPTAPVAPTIGTAVRGSTSATVNWTPNGNGGSPVTRFDVRVVNANSLLQVGALRPAAAGATSLAVTGLTNGTGYRFQVRAVNAIGTGVFSTLSATVTPAAAPSAPIIGVATNGTAGGAITATARWSAPTSTGGSAITGYRVVALRMSSAAANATVLATTTSAVQPAGARTLAMTLSPGGTYRFQVVAVNAVGSSANSPRSNAVTAR